VTSSIPISGTEPGGRGRPHALPGAAPTLRIEALSLEYVGRRGVARVTERVSLEVWPREIVGLIGESGSGKTMTALAVLGLTPRGMRPAAGDIRLSGKSILRLSEAERRSLRGDRIALIPQDALRALNPVLRIDKQVGEPYVLHRQTAWHAAKAKAVDLLRGVHLRSPEQRALEYPHQFSGGMQQRAMIAMGLALGPELLIADEPTTALDVTVQAQILDLMKDLQKEFNSAIILITHDLGVVAKMTENVVVMYGGRVVESGNVRDIFYRPEMPYTWGLLGSIPRVNRSGDGRLKSIRGTPPSLINLPKGCPFQPRCDYQDHVEGASCVTDLPELLQIGQEQHRVRCHIESGERKQLFTEQIKPSL
jgi:peptide/nickel transport system ATP-binding protein